MIPGLLAVILKHSLLLHYSSAQEQNYLKVQWSVCVKISKWQTKYLLDFTETAEETCSKGLKFSP